MKDKYIKRKRNKFIILGFNIFLIILTLILLFKEYSKIYDSEAAKIETVNLILKLSLNKSNNEILLDEIISNNGFSMNNSMNNDTANKDYELIEQRNGISKKRLQFDFQEYYVVENESNLSYSEVQLSKSPLVFFDKPVAYVSYQYEIGSEIKIRNIKNNTINNLDNSRVNNSVKSRTILGKSPNVNTNIGTGETANMQTNATDNDGFLDILYISSGYTDFNTFQADAKAMGDFLLTVPPFSQVKNKIRISKLNNSEDMGCRFSGTRLYICDLIKVHKVASQVNHDSIVVVINSDKYGGGYLGQNIATTYRDVSKLAKEVMVHEFGHSFGKLADEYDYGVNYTKGNIHLNCDLSNSCDRWSNVSGTGCFKVCGFSNTHRSTYNDSIMRSLKPDKGFVFGTVSCKLIASQIKSYTGVEPSCLSCNSTCTKDSECSNVNSNWFCAQQYNYGPWNDDSRYLTTIQYKVGNETKTESGINYGLNQQVTNGITEQHLVKNNKLFYRTHTPGVGWSAWTDQTANVANVGCNLFSDCGGSVVGFNTYYKLSGKSEQQLLRRNASSFKLFSRNNENGWSSWVDVTSNVSGVGSGTFTSFTSFVHPDGYIVQNIVRGGELWERTSLGGWKPWVINNGLNSCVGTTANNCFYTTLISIEKSILSDGTEVLHVFREGNKNYSRTSSPTDQRCKANNNIFSNTCQ